MKLIPTPAYAGLAGTLLLLPLALPQEVARASDQDPMQAASTIVIRYEPEAIFLTHHLVEPICREEVHITQEGAAAPVGTFTLLPMDSNALQPRGVFVGRALIDWSAEAPSDQGARDALFAAGLEQLRGALSQRLYDSKQAALRARIGNLEEMLAERMTAVQTVSQRLAASRRWEELNADIERLEATLVAVELERRVARTNLTSGMNLVQRREGLIKNLVQRREGLIKLAEKISFVADDLNRKERLLAAGQTSQGRIDKAALSLATAKKELEASKADLTTEKADVDLLAKRVEASELQLVDLLAQQKKLLAEQASLSNESPSPLDHAQQRMALALDVEVRSDQTRELQKALERLRIELRSFMDVTVQTW